MPGRRIQTHTLAFLLTTLLAAPALAGPSAVARSTAEHAHEAYRDAVVETLAELIAFRTVHQPGTANADHPEFQAMSRLLQSTAEELGLDFADHGAVVVIGLGDGPQRFGIVTHGDVQPADPTKWAADPFTLDTQSEPGRLVGRGVEDDKGPIATALYAMKAVADRQVPLARRIELIVSYTEESDWEPFQRFLAAHPPPEINVAIDAEYPVVVAEKGWGALRVAFPAPPAPDEAPPTEGGPYLQHFTGGAFLSQIPADAEALILRPTPALEGQLLAAARRDPEVVFSFEPAAGSLRIRARGHAAHSSKPWEGVNAIAHLANLLASQSWPDSPAAGAVRFLGDLVGTGDYGERFGEVAFEHPFMGKLTLSATTLTETDGQLVLGINLRRPAGVEGSETEAQLRAAVEAWRQETGLGAEILDCQLGEAHLVEEPPHVPPLLEIFSHYTGRRNPQPISIGGGTHARLVPGGVNFGPAMPGETYTGHTEHEFMSRRQLDLNLKMYTAMLVELAGETPKE